MTLLLDEYFFLNSLFIYFGLCGVFAALEGFLLGAASQGLLFVAVPGFSKRSTGSRRPGFSSSKWAQWPVACGSAPTKDRIHVPCTGSWVPLKEAQWTLLRVHHGLLRSSRILFKSPSRIFVCTYLKTNLLSLIFPYKVVIFFFMKLYTYYASEYI